MSVNREIKEKQVQAINEAFNTYNTFYLLDYVNISVSKAAELRKNLRENECTLKVIKNRLALKALQEDFPEEIRSFFVGPTAIAFTDKNPIVLARMLKDFSVQYRILKVKAGLVEGQFLSEDRFKEISSLTSRTDLVAKLGYLMAYPLTQLLKTWKAPFSSLGSMMSQLQEKK